MVDMTDTLRQYFHIFESHNKGGSLRDILVLATIWSCVNFFILKARSRTETGLTDLILVYR